MGEDVVGSSCYIIKSLMKTMDEVKSEYALSFWTFEPSTP